MFDDLVQPNKPVEKLFDWKMGTVKGIPVSDSTMTPLILHGANGLELAKITINDVVEIYGTRNEIEKAMKVNSDMVYRVLARLFIEILNLRG